MVTKESYPLKTNYYFIGIPSLKTINNLLFVKNQFNDILKHLFTKKTTFFASSHMKTYLHILLLKIYAQSLIGKHDKPNSCFSRHPAK